LQLTQSLLFDKVSPATRLLEKRRQMFEVEDALTAQKEDFARREEAFHRREDGLRRKDLELQDSLIKFNKFLRENEAKRVRALKRLADETKLSDQKDSEIQALQRRLEEAVEEDRRVKRQMNRHMKYQKYLDSIVREYNKDFSEVADILNRYQILREANSTLVQKQREDEEMCQQIRAEAAAIQQEKENDLLTANNRMADMRRELEQSMRERSALQGDAERAADDRANRLLLLGQIIRSISNLFDRCEETFKKRHNKSLLLAEHFAQFQHFDKKSLEEQFDCSISKLEYILFFIQDLASIKETYLNGSVKVN
jgi:myosin heavy subunit